MMIKNLLRKIDRRTIGIILYAAAVLSIVSIAMLLQDSEPEPPSLQEVLSEKISAYETDLLDSLGSMNSSQDVAEYLMNWAKNKEIKAETDDSNSVIYHIPAAEHAASAQPAVIVCSFDASQMEVCIPELSAALCIAKNAENNGAFRILFLAEEDGQPSGAEAVSSKYFPDGAAVFCLDTAESAFGMSAVTGGSRQLRISFKPEYTKTGADPDADADSNAAAKAEEADETAAGTAYTVEIRNLPSAPADKHINAVPNPIKILGDVLADLDSSSFQFDLADFSGGSSAETIPAEASFTIVTAEEDCSTLEESLKTHADRFYRDFQESFPEAEFTWSQSDMPKQVISDRDTERIISLLYSLPNGVHTRDEDGNILAMTNTGRISFQDDRMRLDLSVTSCSRELMDKITETLKTTCSLRDMKFKIQEELPMYDGTSGASADAVSSMISSYKKSYRKYAGTDPLPQTDYVFYTICSVLQEKNESLPILYLSVDDQEKYRIAGSIITWLDQGEPEPEA